MFVVVHRVLTAWAAGTRKAVADDGETVPRPGVQISSPQGLHYLIYSETLKNIPTQHTVFCVRFQHLRGLSETRLVFCLLSLPIDVTVLLSLTVVSGLIFNSYGLHTAGSYTQVGCRL